MNGWKVIDKVTMRQAITPTTSTLTWLSKQVSAGQRWAINRISLGFITSSGNTNVVLVGIQQPGDGNLLADYPEAAVTLVDQIVVVNASVSYSCAAQNYPDGCLWVPEDCILTITAPDLDPGFVCGLRLDYTVLAKS